MTIIQVVSHTGICPTNAEARRLIVGGGVKVNGEVVRDINLDIPAGEYDLKVGRRESVKVSVM